LLEMLAGFLLSLVFLAIGILAFKKGLRKSRISGVMTRY